MGCIEQGPSDESMCARSEKDPKFVYYLSAEFLMGRSLMNAVQNLELTGMWLHTQNLSACCTIVIGINQEASLVLQPAAAQ